MKTLQSVMTGITKLLSSYISTRVIRGSFSSTTISKSDPTISFDALFFSLDEEIAVVGFHPLPS